MYKLTKDTIFDSIDDAKKEIYLAEEVQKTISYFSSTINRAGGAFEDKALAKMSLGELAILSARNSFSISLEEKIPCSPITITYFKHTGKYYSETSDIPQPLVEEFRKTEPRQVIRTLNNTRDLPGIASGSWEGSIQVVVDDLPYLVHLSCCKHNMGRIDYQKLQQRVHKICLDKGWDKSWVGGGCYLHLESSELIEALRGKNGNPIEEGGDVIFTLCALLANYNISIDDCAEALSNKLNLSNSISESQ